MRTLNHPCIGNMDNSTNLSKQTNSIVRNTAVQKVQRSLVCGFILLPLILLFSFNSNGQTVITTNTLWSSLTPQPTSSTNIFVENGATLTVDVANAVANSLTIASYSKSTGYLTYSGSGNSLVVTNAVTVGLSTNYPGSLTVTSGNSLTCGSIVRKNGGSFNLANGNLTLTGAFTLPIEITAVNNLTLNSTADLAVGHAITINGSILSKPGSKLSVTMPLTVTGNLTEEAASGASIPSITTGSGVTISGNLSIGAGATYSAGNGNTSISGNLSIGAGSTLSLIAKGTVNVGGATNISGTLTVNPGNTYSSIFTGDVTIASGGGLLLLHP